MAKKQLVRQWVVKRAQQDDYLYERYGKGLEPEHTGELVAISDDGRLIRDDDELTLARQARDRFGPGNFTIRRIGRDAEIRWRRPNHDHASLPFASHPPLGDEYLVGLPTINHFKMTFDHGQRLLVEP